MSLTASAAATSDRPIAHLRSGHCGDYGQDQDPDRVYPDLDAHDPRDGDPTDRPERHRASSRLDDRLPGVATGRESGGSVARRPASLLTTRQSTRPTTASAIEVSVQNLAGNSWTSRPVRASNV